MHSLEERNKNLEFAQAAEIARRIQNAVVVRSSDGQGFSVIYSVPEGGHDNQLRRLEYEFGKLSRKFEEVNKNNSHLQSKIELLSQARRDAERQLESFQNDLGFISDEEKRMILEFRRQRNIKDAETAQIKLQNMESQLSTMTDSELSKTLSAHTDPTFRALAESEWNKRFNGFGGHMVVFSSTDGQ